MRMLATKYSGRANPLVAKKLRAQVVHVAPPLKGLSLASRFVTSDPLTAIVLKNFVIEDNRISCRAGYIKTASRGTAPVWHLVPYYGLVPALAAASNHELWNAQNGALIRGGFTSDDWHWSAFANLGQQKFTILVNGSDGVWSWNGTLSAGVDPAAVPVTSLNNGNPVTFTVAVTDIGKFQNGMTVVVSGATGGLAAANGSHAIQGVATPANTYALVGVSGGTAPQTTGVTVDPPALQPITQESIYTDPNDTFINPSTFNIVLAHQNRLFFADSSNLAIYYLPLQQKSGQVKYLPLNAVFKRGGTIRAMYTWSIDGGAGQNDVLAIFTSNGEAALYQGYDPDTNFVLSGVYRFDPPMSKHSVVAYGGELYVLIPTGLVPMSTLMRAESEQLGTYDRALVGAFLKDSVTYRTSPGWMAVLNPSSGRLFCNIPQGSANRYKQYVRHMPNQIWSEWADVPSRCWGWIDPFVYFGDDSGNVYQMHPVYQNDNGQAITVDVFMAWSSFKTSVEKHFTGVKAYMITDGDPHPVLDVKVDYDETPGVNAPDITLLGPGAIWDTATWDVDYWAPGLRSEIIWNGVDPSGVVGAVRLTARIDSCAFSITGFDVQFEAGKVGP